MTELTLKEASEIIGCTPQTLRRAIVHGLLLATEHHNNPRGKYYTVTPEALAKWRKEHHNPKMKRSYERKPRKNGG